ncbi:hypothetical protein E2542_SST10763 [Spatholobus suberectus]|nr:hypothetical protein E2542_SST10763 [Spatholobus suberectus]
MLAIKSRWRRRSYAAESGLRLGDKKLAGRDSRAFRRSDESQPRMGFFLETSDNVSGGAYTASGANTRAARCRRGSRTGSFR